MDSMKFSLMRVIAATQRQMHRPMYKAGAGADGTACLVILIKWLRPREAAYARYQWSKWLQGLAAQISIVEAPEIRA